MALEKLVIKELSNKAEIINIFNCLSGYMTILDGASTSIDAIERVFSGIYEKNDLKIAINESEPYDSTKQLLVGYNSILKDNAVSVLDTFKKYGFLENDVDAILNTYGLQNIKDLKIFELDDDKKKRLEYAIAFQSDNKALIIKNPFKDIIAQWKEPIAKYICTYADKKHLPVIITELDYEPSFWSDKNLLKKFKLGIARTKTIGFGTNNEDLKDFISQIRNEIDKSNVATPSHNNFVNPLQKSFDNSNVKNENIQENVYTQNELKKTQDPIRVNDISPNSILPEILEDSFEPNEEEQKNVQASLDKKKLNKIHRKLFILCMVFLALSLTMLGMLLKIKDNERLEQEKAMQEAFKRETQAKTRVIKKARHDYPYILDNYPEWIKQSIEEQLKKKEILKSKTYMPLINNKSKAQPQKKSNNLFKLLEEVSGSGKDLPDSSPNYSNNSGGYNNYQNRGSGNYSGSSNTLSNSNTQSDAEAKRQLLYQRFQEAIRRSREKK